MDTSGGCKGWRHDGKTRIVAAGFVTRPSRSTLIQSHHDPSAIDRPSAITHSIVFLKYFWLLKMLSTRLVSALSRKTSQLPSNKSHPRRLHKSNKPSALTNSNQEFVDAPRGKPSTEYHRTSTRYTNSTVDLLKALSTSEPLGHVPPKGITDTVAHKIVRFLRVASDAYFKDNLVYRAMMLETVAAVPGMVGGMIHHLRSLRTVQHDNWIRTLLDEAENERIHLFCFLDILHPTASQRALIVAIQAIFFSAYLFTYIFMPKTSHRFVGYLEEEAYKTYTKFLDYIDSGKIPDRPAPQIAIDYYNMPAGATMRDMVVVIREDERDHATVNHSMANAIVKLRSRDVVYSDISIDDTIFTTTPGTQKQDGQVKALSKNSL